MPSLNLYANNATTKLLSSVAAGDTSLTVVAGGGALFPSLSGSFRFYSTLADSAGNIEIILVSARSGDTFTVVRAQEGTIAKAYAAGSTIELRFTAANATNWESKTNPADLAAPTGSGLVSTIAVAPGSVATTVQAKLRESVSVLDFMTPVQKASYLAGDLIQDLTVPLQNAINFCAVGVSGQDPDTLPGTPALYLPGGRAKVTATLIFNGMYIHMYGDGKDQTFIHCENLAGSCLQPVTMVFWKPYLHDFSIIGNAASGVGIDMTNVQSQIYNAQFERMAFFTGKECIKWNSAFSVKFDALEFTSYTEHCCKGLLGPLALWYNCYGFKAGPGKAIWRLLGNISMICCNGVNDADYWAIFGNDLTGTSPFKNDFTTNNYPTISIYEGNIEDFKVQGIRIENYYYSFDVHKGSMTRSYADPYQSFLYFARSGYNNTFATLHHVLINPGTGAPAYGTTNLFIANTSNCLLLDDGGVGASFYTMYTITDGGTKSIGIINGCDLGEANGIPAPLSTKQQINTLYVGKFVSYGSKVFTPGAGPLNIDITGTEVIRIQNPGACTINGFTWTDINFDFTARTGRLIVCFEGATPPLLKNMQSQVGGMRLKSGADQSPVRGETYEFVHTFIGITGGFEGWSQV